MVALFVVLTFIIFLTADYFVLKARKKEHPAFATMPVFDKNSLFFPVSYLLSRGHVWLSEITKTQYRLGIDEFIKKAFGKISFVELVPAGSTISKGDIIFKLQSGDKQLAFRSPVDGVVSSINEKLLNRNVEDVYNNDWAIEINTSDNAIAEIKTRKVATHWLQDEVKRFKDFLSAQTADPALAGLTMADGGNIVEGAAHHLNNDAVVNFEKSFLMQ